MKKKLLAILFLSMIFLLSMFSFVACGDNSGDNPPVEEPPTQEQPGDETPEPEAPAHVHEKDETKKVVKEATCLEDGYTEYTCACGETFKVDYVKATGHKFSAFVYNNDATETADGTKTATCTVEGCGLTRTLTAVGTRLTSVNDFIFVPNGSNYAVSEYIGDIVNVSIPSVYNGKEVNAIADGAFQDTDVVTVTVPTTITNIGKNAFAGCRDLEQVNFLSGANWFNANGRVDLTDSAKNAKSLTKTYASSELFTADTAYYIYDYQVMSEDKFYLDFAGSKPEAIYMAVGATEQGNKMSAGLSITDTGIALNVGRTRVGNFYYNYENAQGSFKNSVTINPITKNYFNVDGTEDSFVLDLPVANPASITFNGEPASTVAGITVDTDTLTFTKALLASKVGEHNKVVVVAGNYYAELSVCAYRNTDLWSAFHFEDQRLNPFSAIMGGTYEVVSSSVLDLSDFSYRAKAPYSSDTSAGNGDIKNNYVLKLSVAKNTECTMFVATDYFVARRAKLTELGSSMTANRIWGATTLSDGTGSSQSFDTYVNNVKYTGNKTTVKVDQPSSHDHSLHKTNGSRPLFSTDILGAIYNSATSTNIVDYFEVRFAVSDANKISYYDDVFIATGGVYHAATQNKLSLIK